MTHLTKNRLEAIIDALTHSLAGAIEGEVPRSEYEKALKWAEEELDRRLDLYEARIMTQRRAANGTFQGRET
jgi:hypothetical protein